MSETPSGHQCELCCRVVPRTTKHHLTPRSRSKRKSDKRRRADRKVDAVTVPFCTACHKMVHAVLSERELETKYNSIELLRSHEQIALFLGWIVKQDPMRKVSVRWTNDRKATRASRRK